MAWKNMKIQLEEQKIEMRNIQRNFCFINAIGPELEQQKKERQDLKALLEEQKAGLEKMENKYGILNAIQAEELWDYSRDGSRAHRTKAKSECYASTPERAED